MRITLRQPEGVSQNSLRENEPPALESRRLRGPYVCISKKPRLLTCAEGIYNRFDFTAPFTCVLDFLRYAQYVDYRFLPRTFTLRCAGDIPCDIPLSIRHTPGTVRTSSIGMGSSLQGSSELLHTYDHLVVDTTGEEFFFRNGGLIAAQSITVEPGKTLRFYSAPSGVPALDALPVASGTVVRASSCGSGGSAPSPLTSPGARQGISGTSGSSLGTGGGGSGGIYRDTSGDPLASSPGQNGTVWGGGRGGESAFSVSDLWGTGPYTGSTGGGGGAPTVILYGDTIENCGTILSKSGAASGSIAAGGRGGGGCIVLCSPDIVSEGALSVPQGDNTQHSPHAYGGSGGRGTYKVVSL